MPYLALDDNFADNPKVTRLSDRAFRLHIAALCHCSQHLTDGFISESAQIWHRIGTTKKINAQLVKSGLWTIVDGGWQIHDYLDWNASAAQIKEKRRRDRQRKRSQNYEDSARNPNGNGDDSTRIPAVAPLVERSKERSTSGEPAKSVRLKRANPQRPPPPPTEPPSDTDPELPPPDERQRIAAELRTQLLGKTAADPDIQPTPNGSHNPELVPTGMFLDTEPEDE